MSDALPIIPLTATGARSGNLLGLPGQPFPLGTVALEQLPPNLQSLNRQLLLTGQLQLVTEGGTGTTASGTLPEGEGSLFRLTTSSGDILLRTTLNLRPGSGFLLQIPAGNPPRGGVLMTTPPPVSGTPSQTAAAGMPPPAATPTAGPVVQSAPVSLPLLQVGQATTAQLLPATLTTGAQTTTATGQAGAAAPPGSISVSTPASIPTAAAPPAISANFSSTLLASLLSNANPDSPTARAITGGETGSRIASAATTPAQSSAATAPPSVPSAATGNATSPFGQANNLGDIRILAISRPGQPVPSAPTGNQGAVITASVVQSSPEGPTLLKFGEQLLLLQAKGDLPPGTRVQFSLPTQLAQAAVSDSDPLITGGRWGTLEETAKFLQAVNPTTAQTLMSAIPQVGAANLGTTMVFFMAALRLGDVRAWIGENTLRSLERYGNKDLRDRLTDDFGRIAKLTDDPLPGNWRPMSMPLANQGEIGLINFYIKPVNDEEEQQSGGEGDENKSGNKETRFLIDMDMSQLGPLQIDGLAQPGQVDVILRSKTSFPLDMRQELQALFRDILDARGMQGGVTFRHNGEGWITLTRAKWKQAQDEPVSPFTA